MRVVAYYSWTGRTVKASYYLIVAHAKAIFHPFPPPTIYQVGWVGVGWQRHYKTCRSLLELNNQGTVFFLIGGHPQLVVELDHLCEVKII